MCYYKKMQQNIICLTSEFISIQTLKNIIPTRPMLHKYLNIFCNASINCKNVNSETYMGYKIPLQKIESTLVNHPGQSIVVLSKDNYNVNFLRMEESIMTRYPKTSFFMRNSTIEQDGNDTLLVSQNGVSILFVSLYKTLNNVVTIKIE